MVQTSQKLWGELNDSRKMRNTTTLSWAPKIPPPWRQRPTCHLDQLAQHLAQPLLPLRQLTPAREVNPEQRRDAVHDLMGMGGGSEWGGHRITQ